MKNVYYFKTLTSTMDEARDRAYAEAEEGTLIVADQQSEGRGRRGRQWESLEGNLHFTYITYVESTTQLLPELSFVTCVALGNEIRKHLPPGQSLTYKWPNDLLLNDKKVGGILLEAIPLQDQKKTAYLIGCGLNLRHLPSEARYPTTTFFDEGILFVKEELISKFASALQLSLHRWKKEGFSPFQEKWMRWAARLDMPVSIEIQGTPYKGIFKGIDSKGSLMLESNEGLKKMTAGEIVSEVHHASRY